MNNHPLKKLVEMQKKGIPAGICSICSANEYVIQAAMERAMKDNAYVLIESTANQVNQFGGYTGMKPADFRDYVFSIGRKISFPPEKLILGGDHLGPLTWKDEDSAAAMEKARDLIRDYVMAGFTKIHIDTSMRLADDLTDRRLDTSIIADRGALLCRAAEEAFKEYKKSCPDALNPVYVIGSEVPIPGGAQEQEEGMKVTGVADFKETVDVFRDSFQKYGLQNAWENVIGVVVQPGVEFGDNSIWPYDREKAKDLCASLQEYPNLVFEGHSTDYQTPLALKQMVEDGIAILKVGPALTFALREGLFMLNYIENELLGGSIGVKPSNFIEVLDRVMVENPDNWKKYYHGDENKLKLARKYSFSDRSRYYLPVAEVKDSIERLMKNLRATSIPLSLISQFMPQQYIKIRNGMLDNDPEELVKDKVKYVLDDYYYAGGTATL